MPIWLIAIHDFLFLGWFFWLIFAFSFVSFLATLHDSDEFRIWPTFASLIIFYGLVTHFPSLSAPFRDENQVWQWRTFLYYVLLYLAIGVAYAIADWLRHLHKFVKCCDEEFRLHPGQRLDAHSPSLRKFKFKVIKMPDTGISYQLDSAKYPLSLWLSYWPYYLVGHHLFRIGERIVDMFRHLFDHLARFFEVRQVIEADKIKDIE